MNGNRLYREPNDWQTGDVITKAKMNKIESAIINIADEIIEATGDNNITLGEYLYSIKDRGAVRFDGSQSLTSSQQSTARGNIGAGSASDIQAKVDKTTAVNGHALSSNVTVTKSDVGLGNVDNTSDANKPVSIAQQTALDLKLDKANVYNDLDKSVEGYALDARQGKALKDTQDDLKSAINSNGVPYEYNYTGATYRQIDMEFSANTPIYLRCLGGTAQGARFNFIKTDNTRINLAELAQGEERIIIPTEAYKGFRLTPLPYDGATEKSVSVYVNQSKYSICEKIYNIARQIGYAFQPEIDGIIGASSYSEYITNANEAPLNRTFVISSNITEAMIANLPAYGNYALLATITGEKTHNISLQLYAGIATNVSVWFRTSNLSGSSAVWSDWKKLLQEENITDLLYDAVARGDYSSTSSGANMVFSYDVSGGDHYRLYVWGIKNAADGYPEFRMHNVGGGYTSLADIDQIVDGTHYWDVIIPATGHDYVRLYMQKETEAAMVSCKYSLIKVEGSIIDTMQGQIDNTTETVTSHATNIRTCKIFKKVVCCGDSYTSGHIQLNGEDPITTNEEFAWPHFMSTLTGNEWINCGRSGATSVTWQTYDRGLPAAQAAGHAQAYVLALMINDQKATGGVPLGTSSDIGTNNETYYAQMSKIIRELNTISPLAKIFVCTCPMSGSNFDDYSEAVRTIVQTYKNTYPVHCLDLRAYAKLYKNQSLVNDAINGHYTAIGYEQFSEIMAYIMSDYINNHISDFQNVHQIPYTGHE